MEYHFKMNIHATKALIILSMFLITISSTSCISETKPVLKIGGIPDQDTSRIARRYDGFSKYLSDQLNVNVQYVPSINYAAVVTAFTRDELQLAFFGGLTGVQARLQTPGATVIAQREHDAAFHSKFIANPDSELTSLADVKKRSQDLTITFGSESSTSGHLMPRHFLGQAGINADYDFKSQPNFSGSHDYNWTVRPALDLVYGHGFTNKLKNALLELNMDEHSKILDLFSTEKFVTSDNANYDDIEDISRTLGIVK
jgi:phosphonate transport system substrate-binding protein